MTTTRRDGIETPFSEWLRSQADLDSITHGLYVTDQDMIVHKYKENIDSQGWRGLQLMQMVEVKTFNAVLSPNQHQVLFFHHQLTYGKRKRLLCSRSRKQRGVWHFGCSILQMSGALPGRDDEYVRWGRFDEHGTINWRSISVDQLRCVLRFDNAPDTLEPFNRSVRRHHKKTVLECVRTSPLGFDYVEQIVKSS